MSDMRYFNLILRGKPMGSIHTTCPHNGQALWDELCDEYPESYGEHFALYEGEYDEEIEETYGDAYERGLIMYAKECSEEDAHPLRLDDEDIMRTLDDWQPCLTAYMRMPEGGYDIWQEGYATWGDAMRDAEEKWAMLPEGFKDAVRSGGHSAYFELRMGMNGPAVRDWSKDYIVAEVTMPRNSVGISRMRGNSDDDRKTICYTLIPYPGVGVECRTVGPKAVIDMAMDRYGLSYKSQSSIYSPPVRIDVKPYSRMCGRSCIMKGDAVESFDYDGFMPIQNIRYILRYLPSISYSNNWVRSGMTFIDDGELDRALEANKDWLAFMDVKVTRLKDTMRARPDVFEGTYLGSIWDWDTRTEVWPADKEGQ